MFNWLAIDGRFAAMDGNLARVGPDSAQVRAGLFLSPLAAQDQIMPGDPVVIVGGGNSAGQAAIWLADHEHPVTLVIRGESLAASMSRYLIDRIAQRPAIT